MIQLYCGDGKGKTSSAVGGAVRAAGVGYQVLFTQFMKGNPTGELEALGQIQNIRIARSSKQFGFYSQLSEAEKKELTAIHNDILGQIEHFLEEQVAKGAQCFVILDEITHAVSYELIDCERLYALLSKYRQLAELVLTGRNPSAELREQADYISELACVRHPYEQGIAARKGIEY